MKAAKQLFFGLFLVFCSPLFVFGQDCLPNGDMTGDGALTAADLGFVVLCVFDGTCPPMPGADLNCDGFRDLADVLLENNCIFNPANRQPLGPCPIPNVRPTVADPADQVIVQTRIILPAGAGAPYTSLKVWITNKDPIRAVILPLAELQTEPPVYAVLSGDAPVTFLTPTIRMHLADMGFYAGIAPGPDPFLIVTHEFSELFIEPPNLEPKALLDINFDVVLPPCGTVVFDSLPPVPPGGAFPFLDHTIAFVNVGFERIPVNFRMGALAVKGDITGDGFLSPADVSEEILCVFLPMLACATCPADNNLDGALTPSDLSTLILAVFLGTFSP